MLLSVSSNIPCILQGPTASGETFLVKHFAKLVGKDLKVIEMTTDSRLSLLTHQMVPTSKIYNEDILKELFKKTIEISSLSIIEGLSEININNSSKLNFCQFRKILNGIKNFKKKIYQENKNLLTELKTNLLSELSF